MLPFLASSVVVRKADGSEVKINSDTASDEADGDESSTTAHTASSSKHSKQSGSHETPMEVVPIVAIVFVFLWLIVKALMAPFTQRASRRAQAPAGAEPLSEEEQAVLVKLQQTIVQMERRIESLETILIDEHRAKEKYGSKI